jgi:hypothetical protein
MRAEFWKVSCVGVSPAMSADHGEPTVIREMCFMGIPMSPGASNIPIAANVPFEISKAKAQLEVVVGKKLVVSKKEVPRSGADDVDPVQSKCNGPVQ